MNRKRAVKIPYEGYTLPPSSEKGGQFVKDGCGIRLIIMHYLCVKRYLLRVYVE